MDFGDLYHRVRTLLNCFGTSWAVVECYLGIDVGFSDSRPTTGLCLLTLSEGRLRWRCRNTGTEESKRLEDLRELVPAGTRLSGVGIDGPLGSSLKLINRYRAADALLSRGAFQQRCKPGPTNSPTGQRLHYHATKLANLILKLKNENYLSLADATQPDPIHRSRIVEVFPDAFLGVMLGETDFNQTGLSRGKSDRFWETAVCRDLLGRLITRLAPGTDLDEPLGSIRDHDHRAAFVCALAALCVTKNQYVAVGDYNDGSIVLPPCDVWGLNSSSQNRWGEVVLRKNMASVRENRVQRQNHNQARAICNGRRWF